MSRSTRTISLAGAGFVAALLGVLPASAQTDAITTLVEDDYNRAVAARDLEAKMQLYAADAIVMPPREEPLVGSDAIRAWHQVQFEAECACPSTVTEVQAAGDWGFVRGDWSGTITPGDGTAPRQVVGSFLTIVQRQADGTWKIAREIWTSIEVAAQADATGSAGGAPKERPFGRF